MSKTPTIREQIKENPCTADHQDKTLLITRGQGDGTSYSYCLHCGWVDVKSLISQSVIEARLDEVNLAGNRMATITTFTEAGYNLMMEHLGKRIVDISMGRSTEELKTLANKGDK